MIPLSCRRQRRPTTILFRHWKKKTRARALSSISTVVAVRDDKVPQWRTPAVARPSQIAYRYCRQSAPRPHARQQLTRVITGNVTHDDVTWRPRVVRIWRQTVPMFVPRRALSVAAGTVGSARRASSHRRPPSASGVQRQRRWTSGRSLRWGNFFPSLTS